MVDTPVYTPEQIALIKDHGLTVEELGNKTAVATRQISNFNTENTDTFGILEKVTDYCKEAGTSLENMGNLSGTASLQFGLFATAIAGANEHFKNFTSDINTSRLGSFSNQFKSLMDTVGSSPAFSLASEAGQTLVNMLQKMSGNSMEFQKALSGGIEPLKKFGQSLLTAADNSLRFQAALMQGAAQGGNLNELYKGMGATFSGIGDHLGNLNEITAEFQAVMSRAMTATGTESVDEMGKFTASLLQIPGGLEAMTKGMDVAGSHTDTLTAIMQLADGAGLDINNTLQDIHKTTAQFGIGIDNSTRFMARFVDVSQDLHAQQADVRDALMSTTNQFKMFSIAGIDSGKMIQGVADTVKNYAYSLEAAGVPAQNALAIAKSYTSQFESLSEAQEAFISQRSGGRGGIVGALKFEDLLRQDPAAASAKIAASLKRAMGGTILSKQEAEAKGELGAAQYMRQRLLLTQGVLGIKAASKEEADAMLAAMKQGKALPKADAAKVLADTAARGREREQLAYTGLKEVNMTTENVRLQVGTIVLGGIQTSSAARAGQEGGVGGTGRGINLVAQERLGAAQEAGMHPLHPGATAQMTAQLGQTLTDIMPLMVSGVKSIGEQVTAPTPTNLTDAQLQSAIQARKQASILPAGMEAHNLRAGQRVGAAIPSHATPTATTHGGIAQTLGTMHGGPVPVSLAPGSTITVNLTGVCPHCHTAIPTNPQNILISPGAPTAAQHR